MAQPVNQVGIRSPGYQGLNTELSPINGDPEFALVADNCVVDQIGRLTTRQAFADYIKFEDRNNLEIIKIKSHVISDDPIHGTHREAPVFVYREGNVEEVPVTTMVPVGGHRKLPVKRGRSLEITGEANYGVGIEADDGSVADVILPNGYGADLITAELVDFKDELYLFSKGNAVVKLEDNEFKNFGAQWVNSLNKSVDIDGDIAISAYGRLWVSGVSGDYHVIHYSSLLNENQWYESNSDPSNSANLGGLIDVREYWPVESDTIVNIHAHNGFLYVFGRNSILIYSGADSADPAGQDGLVLQDTISNVGLVRRDAICNIGTDVLFVDESGVRAMGRVIQEKSSPLTEPSMNIRREIQEVIMQELTLDPKWSGIKMEYWPSKSLALMLCTGLRIAYVFHLNMPSKTGGYKVTRWTNCFWIDSTECKMAEGDVVYMGGKAQHGLLRYKGYVEGDEEGVPNPYIMKYEGMAMALGQNPMQTVIPKSIYYVCMGEYVPGMANAMWGFSDKLVASREFQIDVEGRSRYALHEFSDDGEEEMAGYYSDGGPHYAGYKVNTNGSGALFRVGLEIKVQGGRYALQEYDINSAVGRITA
jgi:hypothetical protein